MGILKCLFLDLDGERVTLIRSKGFTRYFYLKTQEKILRESLKSRPAVDKTLDNIRKDIQTVETKLDEFNQRLPKKKNIDEILKQVTHASSRAGVATTIVSTPAARAVAALMIADAR